MPARRKRRINKFVFYEIKKKRYYRFAPKKIFIVLIFLVFVFLISFRTRFWGVTSKFQLVVNQEDIVAIYVFDKEQQEITKISVPKSTQVEVARQLGTWKIGSVWELGLNENLGGKLLTETVTRHFKLPVIAWADKEAQGFFGGGPLVWARATFFPYKTNLLLGDRLKVGLFALGVSDIGKDEIDLSKGTFLKKIKLVDGSSGYSLSGKLPPNITSLFSDSEIVMSNVRIAIFDSTDEYGLAEEFGEILEVLGGKVVAINSESLGDLDCEVASFNKKLSEKVARVFSCEIKEPDSQGNFDLVVKLGKKFSQRF